MVDLGGSLAVASRGLFATGVSTDLNGKLCLVRGNFGTTPLSPNNSCPTTSRFLVDDNKNQSQTTDLYATTVTYLASGGKIGDIIRAEVTCDKCTYGKTRNDSVGLTVQTTPSPGWQKRRS